MSDNTVVNFPNLQLSEYELVSELGSGGMATVYEAVQNCFGRHVALKVMSPVLANDKDFSKRFLREAKILASLSHPHIIAVYDVGISGQYHYYAMEHLEGGDLKHRLADIGVDEALLIVKQLALALDHAHSKGYIHRDVKPDNVLFREDGSAVLTDFGIARAAETDQQLTQAGKMIGTPKYMSPEQAKSAPLDARSDLYALGVVFYEMLAGHVPFDGSDPIAVGIQHLREAPPPLPSELADFEDVVMCLLAKEPEQRYQTGEELIAALEQVEFYSKGGVQRSRIDTIGLRTHTTPQGEVWRQELHEEVQQNQAPMFVVESERRWFKVILSLAFSFALGYVFALANYQPQLLEQWQQQQPWLAPVFDGLAWLLQELQVVLSFVVDGFKAWLASE